MIDITLSPTATLLLTPETTSGERELATVLRFFGVQPTRSTVAQVLANDAPDSPKMALLCSAYAFAGLREALEQISQAEDFWRKRIHSVFVYAGHNPACLEALARALTEDPRYCIRQIPQDAEWLITDQWPQFAGAMSGLRMITGRPTAGLHHDGPYSAATEIISTAAAAGFLKLDRQGVSVFLSTARDVIDIDAQLEAPFDIRTTLLAAAPVVMYVKWAFAESCWHTTQSSACLVIDDPLLTPRYGFLHFQSFLELMMRHGFSTSIAFIPWNCRRSTSKVASLFNESQGRYSLCIHGCDHTGGEFGIRDAGTLACKSRLAAERMKVHEQRTGIKHDPVMVFPQGVFSEAAMSVLKRGNFLGVVNSEVISADPSPRRITIADVWDVAVMTYDNFPIFTRRYVSQGLENFAFDVLLGKPCIIVAHHGDLSGQCRQLLNFIDRLNSLQPPLSWRNLGDLIRRTWRQRKLTSGEVEIEMYGRELWLSNPADEMRRFHVRKREADPAAIGQVEADACLVAWVAREDGIRFELELAPGESRLIRIIYCDVPAMASREESWRERAQVMLRRYLSEIRDNYVTRRPFAS